MNSEYIGRVVGGWMAAMLFTTVLYFLSSGFSFDNPALPYPHAALGVTGLYVIARAVQKVRKG